MDEKKRVLVIGGSGLVGSIVLPHLAEAYDIRVFDLKPPRDDLDIEYVQGDLRDDEALRSAVEGCDTLLFMAMGPFGGWGEPGGVWAHFEVATAGLFHALRAAKDAGIEHAVYTSSMSVYETPRDGTTPYPAASQPPDATDFYGLAKRFGEQVCKAAVTAGGISVVALRLCFPTPDERWPRADGVYQPIIATSARDTARAILAGLDRKGRGFEAFPVSGDAAGRLVDLAPTRDVLGWEPLDPTDPTNPTN